MPLLRLTDGGLRPEADDRTTEISWSAWEEGARPEGGRFALDLPNDIPVDEAVRALPHFDAVILNFPVFKDGRAFSQARLLRERCGFKGEIRARGEVLRDQILFMMRAGFTAFEVDGGADGLLEALGEFSFAYQPASDGAAPVWRLRAARSAAA